MINNSMEAVICDFVSKCAQAIKENYLFNKNENETFQDYIRV